MTTTIHSQENELPKLIPQADALLDIALLHYPWLPNNFRIMLDFQNRRTARVHSDITLARLRKESKGENHG